MNIPQVACAFVIGLIVGGGTVYLVVKPSEPIQAAALDIPSNAEASAAMTKHKGGVFPNSTITLGQCDKDSAGPGVRCTADWDLQGNKVNVQKATIGFSRGPNGEWVAVHYF